MPPTPRQAKVPAPLVCPRCSQQWPDGLFCRNCGTPFAAPEPEKPQGKVLLLRVLIVAVPVAIWWTFFHKPAAPPEPEPTKYVASQSGVVKQVLRLAALVKTSSPQDIYAHTSPSLVSVFTTAEDGKPHAALAAGFLLDDSIVATTEHSVRGQTALSVRFNDGTVHAVRQLLGTDAPHDIALLRVDSTDAPPVPLGSPRLLKPGDDVVAIGAADGLSGSLQQGIVKRYHGYAIETNVDIHPQWSGGPLLNMQGEVVGLLTDVPPQPEPGEAAVSTQGKHYALPIEWANTLLAKSLGTQGMPAAAATQAPPATDALDIAFTLGPHAHETKTFATPNGLDTAVLTASYAASQNAGADLTVKVLRGTQVVYDSSAAVDATMKLKLKAGSYSLVVANGANERRQVVVKGTFAAAP